MKKVLILWCEIVDTLKFVTIECNEEDLNKLKTYHGKFINNDEPQGMNEFFYNEEEFKFKKSKKCIENASFDLIIYCGILT